MKYLIACLVALSLSACASATRIVPEGPDSYMAMKQAGSGFTGTENIKVDALEDAGAYCVKQGKELMVTRTSETPGGAFRYPHVEIGFQCLSPGDRDLARTRLQPVPNQVIQVQH